MEAHRGHHDHCKPPEFSVSIMRNRDIQREQTFGWSARPSVILWWANKSARHTDGHLSQRHQYVDSCENEPCIVDLRACAKKVDLQVLQICRMRLAQHPLIVREQLLRAENVV